jgi:hypothetical protein
MSLGGSFNFNVGQIARMRRRRVEAAIGCTASMPRARWAHRQLDERSDAAPIAGSAGGVRQDRGARPEPRSRGVGGGSTSGHHPFSDLVRRNFMAERPNGPSMRRKLAFSMCWLGRARFDAQFLAVGQKWPVVDTYWTFSGRAVDCEFCPKSMRLRRCQVIRRASARMCSDADMSRPRDRGHR